MFKFCFHLFFELISKIIYRMNGKIRLYSIFQAGIFVYFAIFETTNYLNYILEYFLFISYNK